MNFLEKKYCNLYEYGVLSLLRNEMLIKFNERILKYTVPIKPGRKSERKNNPKNRYHINQRKSF